MCDGVVDSEGRFIEEPSLLKCICHLITLGWRIALALLPTTATALIPLAGLFFLQMALLKEWVGLLSCLNGFPEGIFSATYRSNCP